MIGGLFRRLYKWAYGIKPGLVLVLKGPTPFHTDTPFATITELSGDWALVEIMEGPGTLELSKAKALFQARDNVFGNSFAYSTEDDGDFVSEATSNRKYVVPVDEIIEALSAPAYRKRVGTL